MSSAQSSIGAAASRAQRRRSSPAMRRAPIRPPSPTLGGAVIRWRWTFPTFNNFIKVLNQASLAMIIARGLTLAVAVGELDLSIGYAASLHSVIVTGLIVHDKLPISLAIAIVLALGALVGVVNGLIVTKLRVNSVIGTHIGRRSAPRKC
jgi:ribose/xylose/arabinose/galactoside ABC-type transport system permease subunit